MSDTDSRLDDALGQAAAETLRADAAEKDLAAATARVATLEGERDAQRARADAAEKALAEAKTEDADKLRRQITVLQSQLGAQRARADAAEAPARIQELVGARVALQHRAAAILGADYRFDGKSDREIMVATLERAGVKVDGKADEYVRARFDGVCESHATGTAALDRVREAVEQRQRAADATRADGRSARQKFLDEQNNAWRPAAAGGK